MSKKDIIPVQLMFYPIKWERHNFDYMTNDEIIKFVKEHGIDDVKFVPWGTITDWDWSDINYDADLFNDWDDDAEEYLIKECENLIKDTDLSKNFIFNHWCYPVTENFVNIIKTHHNG